MVILHWERKEGVLKRTLRPGTESRGEIQEISIRKCAQWLCVEPALSEGLSVILCTRGEELMEEESVLFSPL